MSFITTDVDLAVLALKEGTLVAIPTETVYGLAAHAKNEEAIKKIYQLKNRPLDHPVIMHVAENCDLGQWLSFIPDYAQRLMDHFWPGPLTLVMKTKPGTVSPLITGGQDTVAIRCPKHPIAQTILNQLGAPLVAPSANPFGKISPTTAKHVQQSFKHEELLIVDGGRCSVGIESTIISAVDPNHYQLLRAGLIGEKELQGVGASKGDCSNSTLKVPGKLERHYQPEKPLYCFEHLDALSSFCKQKTATVYVISFTKLPLANPQLAYQLPKEPTEAAFELYYQLRQADESNACCIAMELPPEEPCWQALRERLVKASYR